MRPTFTSLQYLRAVAALLVVVAHTTEYPYGAGSSVPFWTSRAAALGVEIFFVISGFIITTVSGPDRFNPVQFAWRRFFRIAPLYWISTTALFVVACAAPQLFKTTAADAGDFLRSLLFIPYPEPGSGPNHWSPLLKPGWTLNLEVFFYALTAALFWCGRLRLVLLTAILSGLVVLSFRDTAHLGVLDFYARKDLLAFLAGAWLATANRAIPVTSRGARRMLAVAGAGALIAVPVVYAMPTEWLGAAAAIPAAVCVVSAALLIERLGKLPASLLLERIGDASYSLYLTHMFTVGVAWSLLGRMADVLTLPLHVGGTILAMALAVAVACASYQLVERPFLTLSRRLERRLFLDPRKAIKAGLDAPGRTTVRAHAIQA